ncbi:MAG: hypothetical protein FD179_1459 [Erysipelotrichaceae bacterium]|nr:MAG: hypothetical protein FD179_1459 [Erysipelotrichaceae bacterium]
MNNQKRLIIIFILLATALVITGTVVFFRVPYTTLMYKESDAVISNPSRGFYVQFDTAHLDKIDELRNSGITLVFLAYDIKEFVDSNISQVKLDELSNAFEIVRTNGLKVIFRAAYGFSRLDEFSDPKTIDVIKNHLNQISPILKENKDLLLSVQAGFLGPWGEWHHSNLGDDQGKPTAQVINELLVALMDAVPKPISIAVRRPSFIRLIDSSLVDLSRIAFHNDGLLSSDTDLGTYSLDVLNREYELNYIFERPFPVANGGEMPNLSAYTSPEVALNELSQLKLTYLNYRYNKAVINYWGTTLYEGKPFLELIQKKLGYRWSIQTATLPQYFDSTQKVKIKLTLINTGFSAVTLPYRVELIVSDDSGIRKVIPIQGVNLQDLKPGKSLTLSAILNVSDVSGRFSLGLRILETDMIHITDQRTLIQLANEGISVLDGINYFASYDWDGQKKFTLSEPER